MTLTTPLALLLLLALIPVAYLGWPRLRYRRRRDATSLILRAVMIALVVLALAGAQIVRSADRLAVVFLVDVSGSMRSGQVNASEAAIQVVRDALAEMPIDDLAGLVVFGSNAQIDRALSSAPDLTPIRAVADDNNTDIAEAIRLALAMFPVDAARRIVLLTDGQATVGDTLAAAQLAAAAGVEISYVPFTRPPAPEIQVRDVRAPAVIGEEQEFDLVVTISSEAAITAQINVLVADQIAYTDSIDLRAGTHNYVIPFQSGSSGFRNFEVQIEPPVGQDGFYENNQYGAFTVVEGDPRVLVIATDPIETEYLAPALQEVGLEVDVAQPDDLPLDVAAFVNYDTVILANVSAVELGVGRMEALETWVGDLGGGLVVIGGDEAYAPGGYFQTPLEDALPVEMQLRDQQRIPQLTIAYVIDRSGSMSSTSLRGVQYIDLAKTAIIRSIDFLQPTDRAGVISFDFDAYWVAEFQEVSQPDELQRLVGSLRADGGTSISAAMDLVQDAIIAEPAEIKHIILLTDGGSDPTGLVQFTRDLYENEGITTSVISIGEQEAAYLSQMAEAGGGNYHHVPDADDIPAIFTQEAVLASRSYIVEETFVPQAVGINPAQLHPILNGISAVPSLQGYVATTPRAAAQVILRVPTEEADPILAAWQYGLGRSVAFTSDATARWGANWVSWDDYTRFWEQAVRWTQTEGATGNLETQVVMQDEQARITVTAQDDDGAYLNGLDLNASVVYGEEAQIVQLRQVAPGLYEGTFTPEDEGAHYIAVTSQGQAAEGLELTQQIGWVMTYSPEYELRPTDAALLSEIADLTGGRSLAGDPAAAFAHNLSIASAHTPIWPWLLLAALLLLPVDIAVRRLIITPSDVQRLRAYIRSKIGPRRAELTTEERLSSLRQARDRAREDIRTRTSTAEFPSVGADDQPAPQPEAAASLSDLRQRRQHARETQTTPDEMRAPSVTVAPPAPQSAPAPEPIAPRQPTTEAPNPASGENIGARLLKKRRGDDPKNASGSQSGGD